jgi:hypothetical protein
MLLECQTNLVAGGSYSMPSTTLLSEFDSNLGNVLLLRNALGGKLLQNRTLYRKFVGFCVTKGVKVVKNVNFCVT